MNQKASEMIENINKDKLSKQISNALIRRAKKNNGELTKMGFPEDIETTEAEKVLGKLILQCQKEERPYRKQLEALCYNYVISLFDVPNDMVTIKAKLTDEVTVDGNTIQLEPELSGTGVEKDATNYIENEFDAEVLKRKILNIISMGAGLQLSSDISSYKEEINKINAKLPQLYKKIILLTDYLVLNKKIEPTEHNKKVMGTVVVSLCNYDSKVTISSQGKIFPTLLSETIRGFMELFASHGLPKDIATMLYILKRADYLRAEPFLMKYGPVFWDEFIDAFDGIDSSLIPYLYKTVAELSDNDFFQLLTDILGGNKSNKAFATIAYNAAQQKEYSDFEGRMTQKKVNQTVLSDEISPEEL